MNIQEWWKGKGVSFELPKICWTKIDILDSDKISVRNVTVKFILPV